MHKNLAAYAADQIEAGVPADKIARMIAAYLLDERKSRESAKVMRFIERELEKRGHRQVVITSAYAVTDEVKKNLADMLNVKKPIFSDEIDHSIIGGVKARSGESEIDLTVRGKLNRFKQQVVKSSR